MIKYVLALLVCAFNLSVTLSVFAEPFKVGVIIALTGPAAANGITMRNSIELASRDNPENFSNIKFIYEDAGYDSAAAVKAFNKLKDVDRVDLFYVWGISFCNPVAPLAERAKIPVICQGIEQESYMHNPYVVRFMNSTDQYMKLLLTYIRSQKWHNLGIVMTENPYIQGLLEALQRNLNPNEKITIVDRYPVGQLDTGSNVTKLKRSEFDAVGVFLIAGQIGQFYKLLARQEFSKPTFGTNFFENLDEIKLSDGKMNGAVYVHNEVQPAFLERYQSTFGNKSQLAFGGMAYEFAAVVGELFNKDGKSLSADTIIERFTTLPRRNGKAMGEFGFVSSPNGDRYFDFPAAVKRVEGDTYSTIVTPRSEKVEIGVITTLSGGMATIGTAVKNGIELAREDNPELFRNLEFTYKDDQFDPKRSITAYHDLKSDQKISLLLGFGTMLAQAIGPTIEHDKIPLINFNFEAGPVVGKHYIVRAMNHTDQYMKPVAERLSNGGEKEFPVVMTEVTFFRAMVDGIRKGLANKGKIVEIASVNPSETDFRTLILKMRPYAGKSVGLFLLPDQLIAFMRQARELKFDAQYFGTDLCETAATITTVPGLVDGCLYPDNDVSSEFRNRYKTKFGNEAQLTFAASAYEMTKLVGELFKDPENMNADKMMKALSDVKDRQGVLGRFSYRREDKAGSYFDYPIYVKKIEGPRGVAIK